MKVRSLLIGAAAIVGVVAATSMMTARGNQAIGETAIDAPDVEGNTGIDNSGDATSDQYVLGTKARLDSVSITCPNGWFVSGQTDTLVSVTQDDGDGHVDIGLKGATSTESNVTELLDTGDGNTVDLTASNANEYVIGNTTWHGYEVDGGFALETTGANGRVVSATGRGVTLDEAMEMLAGVRIG